VENWLREDRKLDVQPLPQDMGTKAILLPEGGKRPDFLVEIDDDSFFVDAKLHQTDSLREFSLSPDEIRDFRQAMQYMGIQVLFIALLPREAINFLFLIELTEIENKNDYGTPGIFNLDLDDGSRKFGPISQEEFDRAVKQYRKEGFDGEIPEYPSSHPECHTSNAG